MPTNLRSVDLKVALKLLNRLTKLLYARSDVDSEVVLLRRVDGERVGGSDAIAEWVGVSDETTRDAIFNPDDTIQTVASTDVTAELAELSPRAFERFLGRLWAARGWSTTVTPRSGDDGIDVVATRSQFIDEKRLIQAKHRKDPTGTVKRHTVQQYAYLHQKDGVDEVLLVTNGTFSSPAKESALTANIKLIDGDTLAELLRDQDTNPDRVDDDIIPTVSVDTHHDTADPIVSPADVPQEDKNQVREIAQSPAVYARLLAALDDGDESLHGSLGALLQLFSGPEQIHILLIARPQHSYTDLTEQTLTYAEPSTQVECGYLDSQTLRGHYTQTGEVTSGLLRSYDDGIVALKRVQSLTKPAETLLEPLDEGLISVGTRGYHDEFDVSSSVLATVHTENRDFAGYDSVSQQLSLDSHLLSAFDYICISGSRQTSNWTLPDGFTDIGEDVEPVSDQQFRYHRALAADISPATEADSDFTSIARLILPSTDNDASWLIDSMGKSLAQLARASARIRLSETVTTEDIELAAVSLLGIFADSDGLLADHVSTVENTHWSAQVSEGDERSVPSASEYEDLSEYIKKEIIPQTVDMYGNEPGAPVSKVIKSVKEAGISEEDAEEEIDKLRTRGEAYVPKEGYIRTT